MNAAEYVKSVTTQLKHLKSRVGVETIRQGYKATGRHAGENVQVYLGWPDGSSVDLWLSYGVAKFNKNYGGPEGLGELESERDDSGDPSRLFNLINRALHRFRYPKLWTKPIFADSQGELRVELEQAAGKPIDVYKLVSMLELNGSLFVPSMLASDWNVLVERCSIARREAPVAAIKRFCKKFGRVADDDHGSKTHISISIEPPNRVRSDLVSENEFQEYADKFYRTVPREIKRNFPDVGFILDVDEKGFICVDIDRYELKKNQDTAATVHSARYLKWVTL